VVAWKRRASFWSRCLAGCLGGLLSYRGYKLAGDLPGGRVYAVERVDHRDRDDECGELRFAVVARGLIPDLVSHRVGSVGDPGGGLGERQRGALGVAEIRRLAPRRDGVDARAALARVLELAGVDVHARAAAVDLARAQMHEVERGLGDSFDEIAPIVQRSPEAARQLASRARRRVRGGAPAPEADLTAQWEVVDAFLAAAREGDFDALVAVLDPDVVLRADGGPTGLSDRVQGAEAVAGRAAMFSRGNNLTRHRALINGAAGLLATRDGEVFSVLGITVRGGKIVEINILADPIRLNKLGLSGLD
jgi:ketosteroid isomerase-like protein